MRKLTKLLVISSLFVALSLLPTTNPGLITVHADWTLDLDPPTAGISASCTNCTTGSSSTVTVSCTDTGGSGCSTTNECSVGSSSGPWIASPCSVSSNTTVYGRTRDNAGNLSTNSATVSITFSGAGGPPDLIISSIGAIPSYNLSGTNMSFSATVLNQGGSSSGISNTRFLIDGTPFADMSTNSLATSGSQTLTTPSTWNATAGSHTLTVTSDITNVVSESSEANNSFGPVAFSVYAPLTVTCSNAPSVLPNQNLTWNGTPLGGRPSTYTYSWTFTGSPTCINPAASCASVEDPVVSYPTTGTKTASLTVADGGQTITSSTCSVDANYSAWIQTTGGDVHSNTNISTPGGP